MPSLCLPVVVPDFGVLIPVSMPLRLADDAIVKIEVTFREAPDELGMRKVVTETFAELAGGRVVNFALVRGRGRGCVVIQDTKMPIVNGKFTLPPYDGVDGLVVLGPAR